MINLEKMMKLAQEISIDTTTIDFYGIHKIPTYYSLAIVPENKPAMRVEDGEVFLSIFTANNLFNLERLSKTKYSGF